MAQLTHKQKVFIVQRLACYYSVTQVCQQFKEEFGMNAPTSQVARYQVGCTAAASLSKPLVAAFNEARQTFLTDENTVPIMLKNFRARELLRMYEKNVDSAPYVAIRALEQAAKESGGMYLRPREFEMETTNAQLEAEIQRDADLIYGPEPVPTPPLPSEQGSLRAERSEDAAGGRGKQGRGRGLG